MLINLNEYDLVKAITRTEAKAVHNELPPGGAWRTIKGHHIYIKDGKVLAGSIPGVKVKAKKATKAQLAEHQDTIDKEAGKNGVKGTTQTTSKKPTGTATTKRSGTTGANKTTTKKAPTKGTKPATKGKGVKADDKTVSTKSTKTTKGAQPTSTSGRKPTGKSTTKAKPTTTKSGSKSTAKKTSVKGDTPSATTTPTTKKATKTTKPTGKGAGSNGTKADAKGTRGTVSGRTKKTATKSTAKKPATATKSGRAKSADIRTDAQKNRTLAYDVGDKVGGARKDDFEKQFKEKPTLGTLEKLEKDNGAVAEKLVNKKNILPPFSFEQEHANGSDLQTAILKKLIFDRIAPKPGINTPEGRKTYMAGIEKIHRHFAGVKDWENMRNAIREFSDIASKGKKGKMSMHSLQSYADNPNRYSFFNEEYHMKTAKEGAEALDFLNFHALGDKLENFFTDYKSRESAIRTVSKNMREGWTKYLNPETKAKNGGTPKGGENKKWERKAEAEHLRTGGRSTKVSKPEDMLKHFGMKGVEFGHWVNDSSGKYHLQRSAEAFQDMADVLGIDDKDISLNNRLSIAFGARGKGSALAHYEPDRKVINMTKHGGAGSLAHEWGHAMDNILYQYSNGGQDSLGLASEHAERLGSTDPKLKALYTNLMDAIRKPAPGDKGGTSTITLDSEAKSIASYYPEMRRDASTMSPEEVYNKWYKKINDTHDNYIARANASTLRRPEEKEKAVKKYENARKRELNNLPHYVAKEFKYKNGGRNAEPFKGEIKLSTGKSSYYTRMQEIDGNGKPYFANSAEMFARVFESYVQHKLDKSKRYNNYLVHGTREKDVKEAEAPFPEGKERTHMFKAMENLLSHISKGKALKKALILEILASGSGDLYEELRKSLDTGVERKRSAYNVENPEGVIYIPVNRLNVVYQTDLATNWDTVYKKLERMKAGEKMPPVVIGLNYDIQDGHHSYEASKLAEYEHVPCIVKGGNDIEQAQAIEAYKELWKSIVPDPVAPDAFEDENGYMYRGIGASELRYITENNHIQTHGIMNDDDKHDATCFSNLFRQAEGYAKTNYNEYKERSAYVIAVPKPSWIEEDEHGELLAHQPVPLDGMKVIFIPKPQ